MIQAVIFDMDGLIVDTEAIESRSIEKLIKQYGKNPFLMPTDYSITLESVEIKVIKQ